METNDERRVIHSHLHIYLRFSSPLFVQERETGLFFVGEGSFESRKKVLEVSGCGFGGSQAGRAEAVTAFHAELSGTRLPACLHLPLPSSPPRLLRIVFVHTRVSRVLHPARHYAPRAVVITIAIAVEPNRPRDSVPSFFVPSSHPPPPLPLAPRLSSSTHARTHTYVCVYNPLHHFLPSHKSRKS